MSKEDKLRAKSLGTSERVSVQLSSCGGRACRVKHAQPNKSLHLQITPVIILAFASGSGTVAYLLSRITPENSWRHLWVALVTMVALQYWQLFADPVGLNIILKAWSFYAGLLISTVPLPLAYVVIKKLRHEANAA